MPMRPEPTDRAEVQKLANAVDEALAEAMRAPTRHRDDTPLPAYGPTPPVAQPGTPPMSQWATDVSRMVIATGLSTVPPGLIAIGLLIASGHANPTVVGMVCVAPAALAVPILALARLLRRAKDATPEEHHHHYEGPVYQDQRHQHSSTRGVWAKTTNQQ